LKRTRRGNYKSPSSNLELTADMDIDDQVEAVSDFSIKLLEIPTDVVCFALWRDRAES
jgi:hypothetical protein